MSDLISKQKAIDEIREFQSQITLDGSLAWVNGMDEGFDHAVSVIELMDTVEAEPVRHGHWIGLTDSNFTCSECKETIYTWIGRQNNYCPNCGAKMDEREEK